MLQRNVLGNYLHVFAIFGMKVQINSAVSNIGKSSFVLSLNIKKIKKSPKEMNFMVFFFYSSKCT